MISFLRYYQGACAERTLKALHEVRKLEEEKQENRLKENLKKEGKWRAREEWEEIAEKEENISEGWYTVMPVSAALETEEKN